MEAIQGSAVAASSIIPKSSTEETCTPVRTRRRQPSDSSVLGSMCESLKKHSVKGKISEEENDIPKAASSSVTGTSGSESLRPSEFLTTGTGKQVGHLQSGNLMLPDMRPTFNFRRMPRKVPHPTACMISPTNNDMDEQLPMWPCDTPRRQKELPTSPPPCPAPKMSALMKALHSKSIDMVRQVLLDDPSAAQRPLPETREPSLCAAVRLESCVEILELLLEYGADVNSADCIGQTPLRILRSHLHLHQFEVDVLGAKDLELPEFSRRSDELLLQAQVQTGVLEDYPTGEQQFDMGITSSALRKLLFERLPPVIDMDLLGFFINRVASAGQPESA